jgi:hypothetical protein
MYKCTIRTLTLLEQPTLHHDNALDNRKLLNPDIIPVREGISQLRHHPDIITAAIYIKNIEFRKFYWRSSSKYS